MSSYPIPASPEEKHRVCPFCNDEGSTNDYGEPCDGCHVHYGWWENE